MSAARGRGALSEHGDSEHGAEEHDADQREAIGLMMTESACTVASSVDTRKRPVVQWYRP